MLQDGRGIPLVSSMLNAYLPRKAPDISVAKRGEPASGPSFVQCKNPISSHLGPVAAMRLLRHGSGRMDVAGAHRSDFIRSGARTGNKLEDIGLHLPVPLADKCTPYPMGLYPRPHFPRRGGLGSVPLDLSVSAPRHLKMGDRPGGASRVQSHRDSGRCSSAYLNAKGHLRGSHSVWSLRQNKHRDPAKGPCHDDGTHMSASGPLLKAQCDNDAVAWETHDQ